MGVRRAVEITLDLRRTNPPLPVITYGPLIHNPQTLELLKSRGIDQVEYLDQIEKGTVIIRAHGISPQERQILIAKGVMIIDATCPRVARVQAVIKKHAKQGDFSVIVGDKDHPEVRGLLGFASAGGIAIAGKDEIKDIGKISSNGRICVVAQTTQELDTLNEVVTDLKERGLDVRVYNTICDSTKKRQAEIRRMAEMSDIIVVVGGKGSANTRRLTKIAEGHGVKAVHIETADELSSSIVDGADVVGVTAGASTPNWQIQTVIAKLKEIGMSSVAGPMRRLRKIFDITVMTYVWAAAAGSGLAAACLTLQREKPSFLLMTMTALFVFSMHLLNRIFDRSGAVRFNTPEIAAFYAQHQIPLAGLGICTSLAAILLSYRTGFYSFVLMTLMITAGLLYTMPLMTKRNFDPTKRVSLKEIPGSKTPLVALGWAMATAVLPALVTEITVNIPALIVAFVFSCGIVFWRTALSDLLDIQGDRIVGRETIPILIGVKKTRRILQTILVILAILPVLSAIVGWTPWSGSILTCNVLILWMFWVIYRKGQLVDRLFYEGMMDGNLVLAGIVFILYGMV